MTEEAKDIRWKQRFENYRKALTLLTDAVEIVTTSLMYLKLSSLERRSTL